MIMAGSVILPLFSIAVVISAFSDAFVIDGCANGPEYWCKSLETAVECEAIDYCAIECATKEQLPPTEPVRLGVYYESMCDDCQAFIATQLYPTYEKLIRSGMLAIDLYPFGNAEERREANKWTFTCQHGRDECIMNTVEACALQLLLPSLRFPFIQCVEKKPTILTAQECAKNLSINWDSIASCSTGSQGNYFEHVMALETLVLDPPHYFVPWITLNGTHTKDIQEKATSNLLKLVCDSFPGYKPEECKAHLEYKESTIGKCYRTNMSGKIIKWNDGII